MDILLLVLRLLLAAVFLVAALGKLTDRAGTRRAVGEFGVPEVFAAPVALMLPVVEIAIAAALVLDGPAWEGAVAAIALLALFTVAMLVNLALGRAPDCHCFGALQSEPVGPASIARNLVLIALAAVVVAQGDGSTGDSATAWLQDLETIDRVAAGLMALLVVVLAASGWLLLDTFARNGQLLVRMDALEQRLLGGPSELPPGLEPGTLAPAFTLADLDGEQASLDAMVAEGKPVLLVFTDAHCGPCHELLPDLASWQREDRGVTITVLSTGDARAVRARASRAKLKSVLLDTEGEVSAGYFVAGTPSAVLVDTAGRIGTFTAIGGVQIRALALQVIRPDTQVLAGHHS